MIMRNFVFYSTLVFFTFFAIDLLAQCPMCRMSVQSNMNEGGTAGSGLNTGILYLLATPYLAIGVLGYLWWKNRIKTQEDEAGIALEDALDDIDASSK